MATQLIPDTIISAANITEKIEKSSKPVFAGSTKIIALFPVLLQDFILAAMEKNYSTTMKFVGGLDTRLLQ